MTTDVSFREVSENELYHWKYIKREKLPGGKYRYYYDNPTSTPKSPIDMTTTAIRKPIVGVTSKPVASKVATAAPPKAVTTTKPNVSKEYLEELGYNSKKNVYPGIVKENVIKEDKIYENVIKEDKAEKIIKSKTSFGDLLKSLADSTVKSLSKAGDRIEEFAEDGRSWLEDKYEDITSHFGEYVDAVRSGDDYGYYLSKKKTSDLYKKWFDRSTETTARIRKKVEEGREDPRQLEISERMNEHYYNTYREALAETNISKKRYEEAKTLKGKAKAVADVFEDHLDDHLFEAEYLLESLFKKRKK